jgi:L-rhamnose mutarotase
MLKQHYGSIIKIKPEKLKEYKKLYATVWPGILEMISKCHIVNYSIYHKDGFLFSYFEYNGTDYKSDMENMTADPTMQQWWEACKPCQDPLTTRGEGEWWSSMEEIFHYD